MMTLKPKDRFRLKQEAAEAMFKGLELVVGNSGPNTVEVSIEGNKIIIEVKEVAKEVFH